VLMIAQSAFHFSLPLVAFPRVMMTKFFLPRASYSWTTLAAASNVTIGHGQDIFRSDLLFTLETTRHTLSSFSVSVFS